MSFSIVLVLRAGANCCISRPSLRTGTTGTGTGTVTAVVESTAPAAVDALGMPDDATAVDGVVLFGSAAADAACGTMLSSDGAALAAFGRDSFSRKRTNAWAMPSLLCRSGGG